MDNNFNPYSILGLHLNCSQNHIKKSYKHLAKKYHPDKCGNSDKFMKIQIAYEMLTNNQQLPQSEHTELKKQYDEYVDDIKSNINSQQYHNQSQQSRQSQQYHNQSQQYQQYHNQSQQYQNQSRQSINNINNDNSDKPRSDISVDKIAKEKINEFFESIEDEPISKGEFTDALKNYMKKRNIKSITQLFDKNFDLSIFNQIYNNLKNDSTKIIIKEPEACNTLSSLIPFDFNKKSDTHIKYSDLYDNLPQNPTDKHISRSYKSNPKIIRDDIIEKNYNQNIKKKINAYNNFNFS